MLFWQPNRVWNGTLLDAGGVWQSFSSAVRATTHLPNVCRFVAPSLRGTACIPVSVITRLIPCWSKSAHS